MTKRRMIKSERISNFRMVFQRGSGAGSLLTKATLESNGTVTSNFGLFRFAPNRWHFILGMGLLGLLVLLAWASSYLSAVRMYQVDECQNFYMARVLATGGASDFFTNASLF